MHVSNWLGPGVLAAAMSIVCANARPDRVRWQVNYGDRNVGTCVAELKRNGEFTSTTDIDLFGQKAHSVARGKIVDGAMTSLHMEQSGPGQYVVSDYAGRILTLRTHGKAYKFQLKSNPIATFADYHPMLSASLAVALNGKPKNDIDTFVPTEGVLIKVGVAKMLDVTAKVGAYKVEYTPYSLKIGSSTVWLAINASGNLIGQRVENGISFVREGYEGLFDRFPSPVTFGASPR